ncbi:E3 binding domain-containing protein [Blastococcus sp. SYSU DS0669]
MKFVARDRDYRSGTAAHLHAVPAEPRSLTIGGGLAADPAVVTANTRVAVSDPDVRRLANTRGVLLARVTGTGRNGAITRTDVLTAAAAQDRQRAAAQRRAFPEPAAALEHRISFTASGLPVSVLDEVPPSVRRALAAAPDHATAFALVEQYRGLGDTDARAALSRDRSVSCDHGGIGPTGRTVPGWD